MGDVLVVDDEVHVRQFIGFALEAEGIAYRTAVNGADALARVAEARPAVILLDMNMPVLDGVQFCDTLDRTLGRNATAIVVMTASGRTRHYRIACRAQDALGKPFDLDDLYAVVERHLAA